MRHALYLIAAAILTGPLVLPTGSALANGSDDAMAVVAAFNSAISNRDKDTAISQLAAGGVQFTLQSMHDGMRPEKLTASLVEYWAMVIPVIFASTSSYAREAAPLQTQVHGDIATVWANSRTVSIRLADKTPANSDFTEVYTLARMAAGWKIIAIANNRPTTSIGPNR